MSSSKYEGITNEDLRILHVYVEQLQNIDSWTPAMLSMMICAIRPVPGCTTIPDEGISILKSTRAATKTELENARSILEKWMEGEMSKYERKFTKKKKRELMCAPIIPIDFFITCYEDDLALNAPLLNEFISVNDELGGSLFARAKLETELFDLNVKREHENSLLEFIQLKSSDAGFLGRDLGHRLMGSETDANSIIHKIKKVPAGRVSILEKLIAAAELQVDVKDFNDAKTVYQKCLDLARDNPRFCPNFILKVEHQRLYYRSVDSTSDTLKIYKLQLVRERIRRRIKKQYILIQDSGN